MRNYIGFCGERKTGVPGEKTLGAGTRTNNKLNPHYFGINTGNQTPATMVMDANVVESVFQKIKPSMPLNLRLKDD